VVVRSAPYKTFERGGMVGRWLQVGTSITATFAVFFVKLKTSFHFLKDDCVDFVWLMITG
jgi:hypothetical protein